MKTKWRTFGQADNQIGLSYVKQRLNPGVNKRAEDKGNNGEDRFEIKH